MNINPLHIKLFGKKIRYCLNSNQQKEIKKDFVNSNVLVLGAAGSIGSSFVIKLNKYDFQSLVLLDKDENQLAELSRQINVIFQKKKINKINYICSDLNDFNFFNFLQENNITHLINFAALKHVRSEEEFLSCKYMFETNCINSFKLGNISNLKKLRKIFFISTDKSVYPTSLMGLSKKIMEQKLFFLKRKHKNKFVSSVRFANVSFSNGSILKSILQKTMDNEIFGIPNNIKRYFISHEEAANLCLKSLLNEANGSIVIPTYGSLGKLYKIKDLCKKIILQLNKKPKFSHKIVNFRKKEQLVIVQNKKIIGQKAFEEFYEKDEIRLPFKNDILLKKIKFKKNTATKKFDIKFKKVKNISDIEKICSLLKTGFNLRKKKKRIFLRAVI